MNIKEVVPFLHVSSMERSIRFYIDGLGFTMKHKWEPDGELRWCWPTFRRRIAERRQEADVAQTLLSVLGLAMTEIASS